MLYLYESSLWLLNIMKPIAMSRLSIDAAIFGCYKANRNYKAKIITP